jgi:quercetin dioxygenase-like cupin family protein
MNNRLRQFLTFKPPYGEGRLRAINGHFVSKATGFCLAAVTAVACLAVTLIHAQTPPSDRPFLQRVELPDGKLVATMNMVQGPADREIPRHMHPGVEIGYVLEGSIVDLKIGDEPPKTVNPGESFVVPAYTPHSAKWGPYGLKGLAILMLEKDKPGAIPAP